MIGHSFSSSSRAGMIEFVGGPYDGEYGLFDHDRWNGGIAFSIPEQKVTHESSRIGHFRYGFERTYKWNSPPLRTGTEQS